MNTNCTNLPNVFVKSTDYTDYTVVLRIVSVIRVAWRAVVGCFYAVLAENSAVLAKFCGVLADF